MQVSLYMPFAQGSIKYTKDCFEAAIKEFNSRQIKPVVLDPLDHEPRLSDIAGTVKEVKLNNDAVQVDIDILDEAPMGKLVKECLENDAKYKLDIICNIQMDVEADAISDIEILGIGLVPDNDSKQSNMHVITK